MANNNPKMSCIFFQTAHHKLPSQIYSLEGCSCMGLCSSPVNYCCAEIKLVKRNETTGGMD